MLAHANKITTGNEYKEVVRKGSRCVAHNTITYVLPRSARSANSRFGFIVTKAIGNAVVRNRVRRRLKAVSYSVSEQLISTSDIVIRALPGSAKASWGTLQEEISRAIKKTSLRQ